MLDNNKTTTWGARLGAILPALGIHSGEGLATGLLFSQFIFLGAALFTFYTASNAIFLTHFESDAIPSVYMVSAVLLILVGISFNRLEKRLSFRLWLLGSMSILVLTVVILRIGLWIGPIRPVAYLLFVWIRILWILGNLLVWSLAVRLFNVRQSKRLFPLIMAGAVFAIIIAGLFNDLFINVLGIPNMLIVSAVALLIATGLMFITLRKFRDKLSHGQEEAVNTEKRSWRETLSTYRDRYILWIFGAVILSTLVSYILDYTFVSEAKARFQDIEALASFFGNYMGISTLMLLLVSVFGGSILNRQGLKIGLLANSVTVTAFAIIVLLTQLAFGPIGFIFWLVVLTKLSDDVLVVAMGNTSTRVLYQPLPAAQRVSIQTVVESIVAPLSIGLSGLIIWLFQFMENYNSRQTIVLIALLGLFWIYAGLKVHQAYRGALRKALLKRRLASVDIEAAATEGIQVLREGFRSDQASVVLYAINTLAEVDAKQLSQLLPELLTHPVTEVRLDTAQRIERNRHLPEFSAWLPLLQERLAVEPSGPVRGALCCTLIALGDEQILTEASQYLTHPDYEIRNATLIGLLRYGGIQGVLSAGAKLLELAGSPVEKERVLAAQIVGQVGEPKFYQPLLPLLTDEKITVRRAALEASGQVSNPALWPVVVQALADSPTRKQAARALGRGGASALPAMAESFTVADQGNALRKTLARIAGQIGGPEAISQLWAWSTVENKAVQAEIWQGLRRCGYTTLAADEGPVHARLQQLLELAGWLSSARLAVCQADGEFLLVEALTIELEEIRASLFDLLTFLHDRALIANVQRIIEHQSTLAKGGDDHDRHDNSEQLAYAQEILDDLLPSSLKSALLPLLTEDLRNHDLKTVQAISQTPEMDHAQWLHTLINASEAQIIPWTKACALYAAGKLALPDQQVTTLQPESTLVADIKDQQHSLVPLIQETANWLLNRVEYQL